jgi:hypothetical protein
MNLKRYTDMTDAELAEFILSSKGRVDPLLLEAGKRLRDSVNERTDLVCERKAA